MNEWIDPQLSFSLDAWRQSSRRAPRRHARERAHDAMLDAIIIASRRPLTGGFLSFRRRFSHAGLIASAATVMAAAGVAAAGWNAPPGSALFLVRAARQSVMLKLPGADDTALHLEFAEQSMAEARDRINPAQSIADAANELGVAFAELSGNPSSPLWPRYRLDAAALLTEESGLQPASPPSPPAAAPPEPTDDHTHTPEASDPAERTTRPGSSTKSPDPSPSDGGGGGDDGGGGGGDDGGSSPSSSPGPSPPPDN
ncbi:MAG: hypothetical protein WB808_13790 [Candidatus Dormiibacterota bacterium]